MNKRQQVQLLIDHGRDYKKHGSNGLPGTPKTKLTKDRELEEQITTNPDHPPIWKVKYTLKARCVR